MESLKVKDLQEIAKSEGLKGWTGLIKSDLISFIKVRKRSPLGKPNQEQAKRLLKQREERKRIEENLYKQREQQEKEEYRMFEMLEEEEKIMRMMKKEDYDRMFDKLGPMEKKDLFTLLGIIECGCGHMRVN